MAIEPRMINLAMTLDLMNCTKLTLVGYNFASGN